MRVQGVGAGGSGNRTVLLFWTTFRSRAPAKLTKAEPLCSGVGIVRSVLRGRGGDTVSRMQVVGTDM